MATEDDTFYPLGPPPDLPPMDDGSPRCPDCGGSLAPGSHPTEGDCA